MLTRKRTVFFPGETQKEVVEYIEKIAKSGNEMKFEQAKICPTPELQHNGKFAFFYRPYNFRIHTRKFMNFDGVTEKEEGFEEREDLNVFEYVDLMSKKNAKIELLAKI